MDRPVDPEAEARIRASFARQSMMASLGAELVSIAPGRVSITARVLEGLRQQQGYAHAGLVFSIGDSAAGYAALSVMPADVDVMTVEMKINLLAPGAGRLFAEGRVLKPGRRLVIVAADVWDENAEGTRRHVAVLRAR